MHTSRLSIANIMAGRGRGGLETHFVQLCNHLTAFVDVTAIAHAEFMPQFDPSVRHLPLDLTRSRHNPVMLWQLARTLRREGFDIVHAHANKGASLLHMLRPFLTMPLIGTLHNQKQSTRVFRRLDHAIGVSRTATARIIGPPTTVIYNGLPAPNPVHVDLRSSFDLDTDRPVLVAVGRLVAAKGFDILIDAVSPLDVSLLIAGDGEDAAMLERRVRERASKACILLLGHRDDVTNLIASSDGVVISSRREGFSYVAAETLLHFQRLLSTDVPVANEVLPAELIVPIEDPDGLRERLVSLLDEPERWNELVASAAAFDREHFTIEAMVRDTADLYHRLAAEHSAR
jgi:glycosyltransferase involved in cell wall biosynthesis